MGTEENTIGAVLAQGDAISFEVCCEIEETKHDVGEFLFSKAAIAYFLLVDGLLEGEVVVVAVSVDLGILDAHVIFYVRRDVPLRISLRWILARFLCSRSCSLAMYEV